MKNLIETIHEASKPSLKAVKFENIPGKDLYNELVQGICKIYKKETDEGYLGIEEIYNEFMKGVDSSNINPKATAIIANWASIDFKNPNIERFKWDGKRAIVTDEALNELTKVFETYWDEPVISGVRQTTRGHGGSGNKHWLRFKFPDGTVLGTNLAFGSLRKLLKYATEKNYKSPNIPGEWE